MSAEVEAIARAWMLHQGYTHEEIAIGEAQSHELSGCTFDGTNWDCADEDGESFHPQMDALVEACSMANVAIEALESIGVEMLGELPEAD